jgi:K+-transporting ATPase ATPase C chain
MKKLLQQIKIYVIFTVLLGLVYPVAVTIIAQVSMPYQADGSLLMKGGTVVGSKLIGQNFTDAKYFQGRPSANNYDGTNSGAENLGPTSKKLMDGTQAMLTKVRQDNGLSSDAAIPADMVLSSASGLDPHISSENALLQASRISKLRGISLAGIKKLIKQNTDPDFIGLWGCAGINVLTLNIGLDELAAHNTSGSAK